MTVSPPTTTGLFLALYVVVVACGADPGSDPVTTTTAPTSTSTAAPAEAQCMTPPADARSGSSQLELTIEPHPVTPRAQVTLGVRAPDGDADLVVGAAAEWQCWTGSAWVGTHQLVRDWTDRGPQTLEVPPGATTTIPGIGLPVPNSYLVTVPDVPAGTYRILDVAMADGAEATGFVLVEVASG